MTVRYGLIHLSSPVTRCHHHRQGSAPSFSNSSQTGGVGAPACVYYWMTSTSRCSTSCHSLDELPLDDDEEDDVVLSSSLSTSRFLRGLSLTPPRRGLSLMPRLSIVYWVVVAWLWVSGQCAWAALRGSSRGAVEAVQGSSTRALGLGGGS